MLGRDFRIKGPYKDRNGVALLSGGGSLVLASHDGVRIVFSCTFLLSVLIDS